MEAKYEENVSFLADPPDSKLLRDPIYGYISIPNHVFNTIIDQACFQRLRFIRQTSYEPLYSAALHNRFIHSIGVYYLGRIAFRSFYRCAVTCNWGDGGTRMWERLYHIFTSACLLHDIGHAPFSHSGETFFDRDTPKPLERLIDEVGSGSRFERDARDRDGNHQAAAPHEIMSAYVALQSFPALFENDEEKELFARCITGYLYTPDSQETPLPAEHALKNCLISLLNSSIIDVDRLDYVMRDAYVSGFQNVSIDYHRLLSSISVAQKDGVYRLAYHKSALSIIESVIVAYDSEKKWIQSHPVVLYEHFLIQHAITIVEQYFSSPAVPTERSFVRDLRKALLQSPAAFRRLGLNPLRRLSFYRRHGSRKLPAEGAHPLFSFESLSPAGNKTNQGVHISLLSDDDIIYSIKNIPQCQDVLTKEYFSRTNRRHAIWKSEAEYRALFERTLGPDKLSELESLFAWIENYFTKNIFSPEESLLPIINSTFLEHCKKHQQQLKEQIELYPHQKDYASQYAMLSKVIPLLSEIEAFMTASKLPFDLVVVTVKQFRSAFEKQDIDRVLVNFPKFHDAYYIRDVSSVLRADSGREKFFYLYYHYGHSEDGDMIKVDAFKFSNLLCSQLFPVSQSNHVDAL